LLNNAAENQGLDSWTGQDSINSKFDWFCGSIIISLLKQSVNYCPSQLYLLLTDSARVKNSFYTLPRLKIFLFKK